MKLSIKNRLNFGVFYPQEGNITTQLLVKDIAGKVNLTQDEITTIELKQADTQITWNEEKAKDKEIEFTEAELNFLKEQISKLDGENKISQEILDTCLLVRDYKKEVL